MSNDDKDPVNEWAFLGRGVLRTFVRDIIVIAGSVFISAVIGFSMAYILGFSSQFGIKFGALVGAFIGLSARSHMSRLFDYDHPPRDRNPDA
ncbi:hypothetical protein [Pseudorhodobacter ferrugineus]|uniref:hypothetical protein n=1 Tax=Pseudorhodobacter ferrugineus TaxID=77008 RepID=UPI0003B3B928|nr:hypothetical protein [Pseudorhodobacter ferrugineus]